MGALNDRGQLLLAGAFIVAIALIGLTIVMNATAYTTTLASQENDLSSGGDAISVQQAVRADLARMLREANVGDEGLSNLGDDEFPDRRERVRAEFDWYVDYLESYYARNGRTVTLTRSSSFQEGTRIRQKTTGQMDDPTTGASTVPIAEGTYLRNATFVFTSLSSPTDPDNPDPDSFELVLTPSGLGTDSWRIHFYEYSGRIYAEVSGPTFGQECSVPATYPIEVDIDEGTLGNSHCGAFEGVGSGIGNYDVSFEGGDNALGRYWLIVGVPEDTTGSFQYNAGDSPLTESEEVIYGFTPRFRYYTSSVSYETDLRVTPGELS